MHDQAMDGYGNAAPAGIKSLCVDRNAMQGTINPDGAVEEAAIKRTRLTQKRTVPFFDCRLDPGKRAQFCLQALLPWAI